MFKSTIEYLVRSVGSFHVVTVDLLRSTSQGQICGSHECDLQSPDSWESRQVSTGSIAGLLRGSTHSDKPVCIFSLLLFFDWEIMTRFRNLLEHRQQLLLQRSNVPMLLRFPSGASMPKSCLSCRRRDQTIRKIQDA